MEYLNKDLLFLLCKYLNVHDFHRFAFTTKRIFGIIHNHPYKRLRSENACLFGRKGFKEGGKDDYCCKCWHRINRDLYRSLVRLNKKLLVFKYFTQRTNSFSFIIF